ncbi:MAG TPA: helix-turn-helix transcriptional regulator [Candidatus Binataceae bacterium]|nr:helix-turn-helix transcriptional regulator [Candidatus Binataceae bacterium]
MGNIDTTITRGSGNIFQALGLANADVLQVKADLVHKIAVIIEKRRLTQVEAVRILGVSQPKISALLHGRVEGFSIERIMKYLAALDHDVSIVVKPKARVRPKIGISRSAVA